VSSGFVRSPEGTITLLDPRGFGLPGMQALFPQNINDEGVIIGLCIAPPFLRIVGWVRFP
jgi:hypothetical protein